MRILLVGLGNFGLRWYHWFKENRPEYSLTLVDPDLTAQAQVDSADPFFTTVEAALKGERPDCLLNATPPVVHTLVNRIAFAHRIPVLCEKPITQDYSEAIQIVAEAKAAGVAFMIAENYRTLAPMRKAKQLLRDGEIGQIAALHCDVYRDFSTDKPYWHRLENPFLTDVVVHIMDLYRYFSGSEGFSIFAQNFNPPRSPHTGNGSLHFLMTMQNSVWCSFAGSAATHGPETNWEGTWRIEGSDGVICIEHGVVEVWHGRTVTRIDEFGDITAPHLFAEFEAALHENRPPETSAEDYLKTQALTYFAEESSRSNHLVKIELP